MRFINWSARNTGIFPGFYREGEGGGNKGGDFDLTKVVEALIQNKGGGDASKALSAMVEENYELRTKNRNLKAENDSLKQTKPEGSLTLSKEEVAAYERYKALGKPEDLEKNLKDAVEIANQLQAANEEKKISSASSMFGLKANVLKDLLSAKGVSLELTEIDVTDDKGATSKKPSAFVVKQDGSKARLDDYVKSDLADYQASLIANQQTPNEGVSWVQQQASGGKAPANVSPGQAYLNKAYAKPAETK